MKAVIIVPARFGSTRFPGKPLAGICGRPMIEWVLRGASTSKLASSVMVATDDSRIYDAVASLGFKAVMTSKSHRSGSDRVAEVAAKLDADVIVNLQGDEPLIQGELIDLLIHELVNSDADIATPVTTFEDVNELRSVNTAKVVVDARDYALYFSRAIIPMPRDGEPNISDYLKHIGIYCYRRESLLRFVQLPPSKLELIEKLEQLRALENGMKIKVVRTSYRSVPVDIPKDVEKVESALRNKGLCGS